MTSKNIDDDILMLCLELDENMKDSARKKKDKENAKDDLLENVYQNILIATDA